MDSIFEFLHTDASYLVASLLVLFYAASRFNTPRTVRSQTSRSQYYSSCLVYMLSCEGLLMSLTWLLGQKPEWLAVLHTGSSEALPDDLKGIDAPLIAALMLTTLLPSFPFLRDFDARLLRFFHKMGAIPVYALRWAERMKEAPFRVTPKLMADTAAFIQDSTVLPDALKAELRADAGADLTRFRFTRSLALYVALHNLDARTDFDDDFPEDRAAFDAKMCNFFRQSAAFFTLASHLSREQLDQLSDTIEKFRDTALEAYDDIRLMLSRVLLYSSNGDGEVTRKLNDIGFSIDRPAPLRVPMNLLSLNVIGVVLLFAASTILLSGEHMEIGKACAIGLLVAVNNSIAAVFALLPKQIWGFAKRESERPILAYVISGVCAFTVTLPVSYGFFVLRQHIDIDTGPIMPFQGQCKWLLTSTVLAVALAFACDDFSDAEREPPELRWIESAALAGLTALSGLLVTHWLAGDQAALHPDGPPPSLLIAVALNAAIGALFGFTIPRWYRATIRQMKPARAALGPLPDIVPGTL